MQTSRTNGTSHLTCFILLFLWLIIPLKLMAEDRTSYTAPRVVIGGVPLPGELILSGIKMKILGSRMFHPGTRDFDTYAAEHQDEVINDLVERELFVREGQKRGIRLDQDEFSAFFQKRLDSYGGPEKLEAFLSSADFSLDEYRALAQHAFQARKYAERLIEEAAPITEESLKQYYDDNIEEFSGADYRRFSAISLIGRGISLNRNQVSDLEQTAKGVSSEKSLNALEDGLRETYGTLGMEFMVSGNITVKSTESFSQYRYDLFQYAAELDEGKAGLFVEEGDTSRYTILYLAEVLGRRGPAYDEIKDKVKSAYEKDKSNIIIRGKLGQLKKQIPIEITTGP